MVALADDGFFGARPDRRFVLDDPLLPRISRGRYLSVTLTRPDPRVGATAVTAVESPEKVDHATWAFVSRPGTHFAAAGLFPIEVSAVARAVGQPGDPGVVVVETEKGPSEVSLGPGEMRVIRLTARPGAGNALLSVLGVAGQVELSSWELRPLPDATGPSGQR